MDIATQARRALEALYGPTLRGVYLYGSGARDELTADSDIDIAVILSEVSDPFAEHEQTSELAADLSLEYNTVVTFLFIAEKDFHEGLFLVYRVIKREGIAA